MRVGDFLAGLSGGAVIAVALCLVLIWLLMRRR
jgi:hypothetical protein